MFELIDVYYINLILVILPLCCFLFKIFLHSSKLINKTKDYIYMFNYPAVVNKVETWLNLFVSMSTIVLYDG